MNFACINEFEISHSVKNSGIIVYGVNNYLMVLGKKTSIYIGNSMDDISINDLKLSEELSMRLKYLLGTLNFFNEYLSAKLFEDTISHVFLVKNINILVDLVHKLENEKNDTFLGNIIDEMSFKRIEIRDQFKIASANIS